MSQIDYETRAEDHQSFLVVVQPTELGQQNAKVFNKTFERIHSLRRIAIPGLDRSMSVRYKRTYTNNDNAWGDFQAHRKVLGLIAIGFCHTHKEFSTLFDSYKHLKEEFSSTLYNSRLIVFGMNKDGSPSLSADVDKMPHDSETVYVSKRLINTPNSDRVESAASSLLNDHDHDSDNKLSDNSTMTDDRNGLLNECSSVILSDYNEHFSNSIDDEADICNPSINDSEDKNFCPVTVIGQSLFTETDDCFIFSELRNEIISGKETSMQGDEQPSLEGEERSCNNNIISSEDTNVQSDVQPSPECEGRSCFKRHPLESLGLSLEADEPNEADDDLSGKCDELSARDDQVFTADAISDCPDSLDKTLLDIDMENKTDMLLVNDIQDGVEKVQALSNLPNGVQQSADSMRTRTKSLLKESTGSEIVFYPKLESAGGDLEDRLKEFLTSLFFVLESKRLGRSLERAEKNELLCAPFEKRDFVGIDTDTRAYRRRCQGRLRKHLADVSLQAGMPGEAILHYQTALDMLKPVNDWLWIGACLEGLCSASIILNYPITELSPMKRNLSFNVQRVHDSKYNDAKATIPTNAADDVVNALGSAAVPRIGLDSLDIIHKYRDAVSCYSKFKLAGIVEIESSLKACRVLIRQKRSLDAAEFLQRIVYISMDLSDKDKVAKYSILSRLYSQLSFHRKAAFFKRIAAMQCVTLLTNQAQWLQCYNLLVESLPGYRITLAPKEFKKQENDGWPIIQLRVLNELVFTARKMSHTQLAIRHATFLIDTMYRHQDDTERKETVTLLETLTSIMPGSPHPLALDSGLILPPVPLMHLPTVKTFRALPLAPHLQPIKLQPKRAPVSVESQSPFIYSPFAKHDAKNTTQTSTMDFCWALGELCEIDLQAVNPLNAELRIDSLGLLYDGVTLETFPASTVLPAHSGLRLIKLVCSCKHTGTLNVFGYTTEVFGVRSHCKLKDILTGEGDTISINVVPQLSQIQVTTSLPKAVGFFPSSESGANIVTSASACLFSGQIEKMLVTIFNIGSQPVEHLNVFLHSKSQAADLTEAVVSLKSKSCESQLPIPESCSACFSIELRGIGDSHSPRTFDVTNDKIPPECLPQLVETLLVIQHSGGEGMKAGYCRESSVALTVEIQPSIHYIHWTVLPHTSCDQCILVLTARNDSGHKLTVLYSQSESLEFDPSQERRFAVMVDRLDLSDVPDGSDGSTYSRKIAEHVNITWSIADPPAAGTASIQELLWSPADIDIIRRSPVTCDLWVGSETDRHSETKIGELVNIFIKVTVQRARLKDGVIHSILLFIRILPSTDQPRSTTEDDPPERDYAVFCSSPRTSLSLEDTNERVHTCHAIFSHTGQYDIYADYTTYRHTPPRPHQAQSTRPYRVTVIN